MKNKVLKIETRKNTKTFILSPDDGGYSVYNLESSLFSTQKRFVGHGCSLENAVLVARQQVGDAGIVATRLRDE
jgi:hypothetical protein